jgi:pimeloyl-ACP methyl ester carboxylesterase
MPGAAAKDVVLDVAGWQLSALRAEPAGPARATILALPGGGYTSAYWHHPLHLDASLLSVSASLGYRVIAVDRPGYGASSRGHADGVDLDEQAAGLAALVTMLASEPGAGAGVFLVGHSLGGILALMIAAMQRTPALLGLDVSGVPRRFSHDLADAVDAALLQRADPSVKSAAQLFYGPQGTFNPLLTQSSGSPAESSRPHELAGSMAWPDRFPDVAAKVRVPLQFTLGEHERVTRTGWPALRAIEQLFTHAPAVSMQYQVAAGHNVSLHLVGRAYHLRALAFLDEIIAVRCPETGVRPPG